MLFLHCSQSALHILLPRAAPSPLVVRAVVHTYFSLAFNALLPRHVRHLQQAVRVPSGTDIYTLGVMRLLLRLPDTAMHDVYVALPRYRMLCESLSLRALKFASGIDYFLGILTHGACF